MTSEMYAYRARLASFKDPKSTSKKRTSQQLKKKAKTTPVWPHETPRPDELARAGFFFQPDDSEGDDNVKCFSCRACLNGWEPDDDPIIEHVSHRPDCAWATAVSVVRREGVEPDERDPLSDQLLNARLQTFSQAAWPHEQKEGHFCTAQRMAEAGWCMDAGEGYKDSATCFYCDLALDGWEPEDDPMEEHKKRQPNCRFFGLLERHHSAKPKAKSKGKSKVAKKARSSKASRASVQSTVSIAPSEMTAHDDASDDEIVAAEPKAKKASRPAATKSSKGRKATQTNTEVVDDEPEEVPQPMEETKPAKKPKKITKKSTKISTVSSTQDADDNAPAPKPRKTTKKASAANKRVSNAADQLQDELEESIFDQFPQPSSKSSQQGSRGVKRTSDGSVKDRDSSIMVVEFPMPPQSAKKEPVNRTSKARSITFEDEVRSVAASSSTLPAATQEEPRPTKRAKSARSTKSARSSHAYDTTDEEERAIELELARIEKEQEEREANAQRQTTTKPSNDAFEILQDEVDEEPYYHPMHPLVAMTGSTIRNTPTPSPTGSDKENTSSLEAAKSAQTPVYMSPTKTTRIPLAPSTPNRMWPAAAAETVSPRKLLGATRSTVAWTPVDLDSVLLVGPQATPNRLREMLVTAAGSLTAEERKMTIEEWLRSRARQQEQELQRRGEEMVAAFEAEGNRALASLEGMHVAV